MCPCVISSADQQHDTFNNRAKCSEDTSLLSLLDDITTWHYTLGAPTAPQRHGCAKFVRALVKGIIKHFCPRLHPIHALLQRHSQSELSPEREEVEGACLTLSHSDITISHQRSCMMCRKQVLSEQNALALQRYNKVGKRNKVVDKMVDSIAVLNPSVPHIQHIHHEKLCYWIYLYVKTNFSFLAWTSER